MNPKFSIIIGAYNQAETIGLLAESLREQTVQNFEVHLCDDGSADETREAFERAFFEGDYIPGRYEYHRQKHKGMRLAHNVNQGIRAARGEYCLFVMGDSFLDPTYLEVMSQFLQPHRILCGVRYHVDHGVGVDMDYRLKKRVIPPENVLLPHTPYKDVTGNGLLVPTQALREHGGWNEEITKYGGDDYDLVARLYYKGYTVWSIVDAKLYHNWHQAKETNPENIIKLKKILVKYAGL